MLWKRHSTTSDFCKILECTLNTLYVDLCNIKMHFYILLFLNSDIDDRDSQTLSSGKRRACLSYLINIMATDDLATKEPGHQEPWYWPSSNDISWPSTREVKPGHLLEDIQSFQSHQYITCNTAYTISNVGVFLSVFAMPQGGPLGCMHIYTTYRLTNSGALGIMTSLWQCNALSNQ